MALFSRLPNGLAVVIQVQKMHLEMPFCMQLEQQLSGVGDPDFEHCVRLRGGNLCELAYFAVVHQ